VIAAALEAQAAIVAQAAALGLSNGDGRAQQPGLGLGSSPGELPA